MLLLTKLLLEHYGINPDQHFDANCNKTMLAKRQESDGSDSDPAVQSSGGFDSLPREFIEFPLQRPDIRVFHPGCVPIVN